MIRGSKIPLTKDIGLLYKTLRRLPSAQILHLIHHRFRRKIRRHFPSLIRKRIERALKKERRQTSTRVFTEPLPAEFFDWIDEPSEAFTRHCAVSPWILNQRLSFPAGSFWAEVEATHSPALVLETLHYHRSLFQCIRNPEGDETERGKAIQILLDWIEKYPPGAGVGWEPFTVAYRIQVWIRIAQLSVSRSILPRLNESLFRHGMYLEKDLELHLGGNHLWKNLSALLMLSSYFQGPTAERWFHRAKCLLEGEIEKQILSDGGHYERSPMYHILVLGDLLDIRDLGQQIYPEWVQQVILPPIDRMADFLQKILHADGEIPFFNDSVLGQAPPPKLALKRARAKRKVPHSIEVCVTSGIARLISGDWTLLFDGGRIGPDELMGHVHNDSLSIEVSTKGRRFLVNRGVYEYSAGPRRTQCRSIRSHNTPCLDGFEQSEIWSSFRVGNRWHADRFLQGLPNDPISVSASWTRPEMPRITRTIRLIEGIGFEILDEFEGTGKHGLDSPFHFGPGIRLTRRDIEPRGNRRLCNWTAEADGWGLQLVFDLPANLEVTLEKSTWWPRFYVEEEIQKLVVTGEIECSERVSVSLRSENSP